MLGSVRCLPARLLSFQPIELNHQTTATPLLPPAEEDLIMLLAASCAELYKREASVYAPLLSAVSPLGTHCRHKNQHSLLSLWTQAALFFLSPGFHGSVACSYWQSK